ncbi:MAG: DUF2520 domain-containing protein [Deltaproteobacteria bacterium]|nr:DUF2520 domain-containing protein [Deltaproteobacteria bacterium]
MMVSVYVIGAGRVGVGLAMAAKRAGLALLGLWNRGDERALIAERLLGVPIERGVYSGTLARADLVLVCVSDEAVVEVGAALGRSGAVRRGAVVAHTSGALAGAALGGIAGAELGSLHPLAALPDAATAADLLKGASFAVEGTRAARRLLAQAVAAFGGQSFEVAGEAKPLYHAACVMAANLSVALLSDAIDEAARAGVADAPRLLATLAGGAVREVAKRGALAALTGPVLRGDVSTVESHLAVLRPRARGVYVALSERALMLAERRGLAADKVAVLRRLLA